MRRRQRGPDVSFPTPSEGQRLGLYQGLARQARLWRQRLRVSSNDEYNERVVYGESCFQALSGAGALSFVTIFLVRLGAPAWLVGLYASVPALITMLAVLPLGAWVQRQTSLTKTVNRARSTFRAVFPTFALLPLLPATVAPYLLVVGRSLASIPSAALDVSVTMLWGRVTSPSRRPRMLSTRLAIYGIVAAVVGLLVGQWLNWAPYPLNYQVLFLSVIPITAGSVWMVSKLRVPETPQPALPTTAVAGAAAAGAAAAPAAAPPAARRGLGAMLTLVRDTPEFRNFAIAAVVFRLGMNLPAALFDIMRVRTLGATDGWIGILLTVERVLSVFAYFAVGALSTRPRMRRQLWLTCVGVALFPATMALSFTPTMLLLPQVIAGLFAPGMNIFLTDTLFQVTPEDQRATFIAANTFLANLIAFVGPILGTALSGVVGIRAALLIAGVLRAVGALVFWRMGVGGSRERSPAASPAP